MEEPVPSDLPDLSGLTLTDVAELPDDVVAGSVRRILAEVDQGAEPVAGFQSAV